MAIYVLLNLQNRVTTIETPFSKGVWTTVNPKSCLEAVWVAHSDSGDHCNSLTAQQGGLNCPQPLLGTHSIYHMAKDIRAKGLHVLLATRVSLRHDSAAEVYVVGWINQSWPRPLLVALRAAESLIHVVHTEKPKSFIGKAKSNLGPHTAGKEHTSGSPCPPITPPPSCPQAGSQTPQPICLEHTLSPRLPCHWKGKHFKHNMKGTMECLQALLFSSGIFAFSWVACLLFTGTNSPDVQVAWGPAPQAPHPFVCQHHLAMRKRPWKKQWHRLF